MGIGSLRLRGQVDEQLPLQVLRTPLGQKGARLVYGATAQHDGIDGRVVVQVAVIEVDAQGPAKWMGVHK